MDTMDRVQARLEDLSIGGTSRHAANQPSSSSRGRGFAHDNGEDDDMARYGAYDGDSREYRDYRDSGGRSYHEDRSSERHPESRSPPRSRRESDMGGMYRYVPARTRQRRLSDSGSGSDNGYAIGGSRFEASRRLAIGDPFGNFPGSHIHDSWSGSPRHRPLVLSPTSRPPAETYRYVSMMAHRRDGPPIARPLSPPPRRRRRGEREGDRPGTQYIDVIVDRDQDSDF
ncbi:hypothetical protein MN608_05318 [Microdochium nivale]|nr:hypothetical protein MN608_05318 [Microdochium nivale]